MLICDFKDCFPYVAAGFIVARFSLYEKIADRWKECGNGVKMIVYALLTVLFFYIRQEYPKIIIPLPGYDWNIGLPIFLDTICITVFMFAAANLIELISNKKNLLFPLMMIGDYSMYMWFAHCIFFNVSSEWFQPILYFPENPILVLLWGCVLCLIFAYFYQKAAAKIQRIKNRLFFGMK